MPPCVSPIHDVDNGRRLLLVCCLALSLAASAQADWPHLRGTDYDGRSAETGLADSWPPEGPPQLWSRELGQGYSGFIVAEGRLYTQRQTPRGQYVLCLDPASGRTLWETRYDWAWQPSGSYPGPYASPTWYAGKVYFASPTGLVGCLNARTGSLLWSLNVREKFQGKGYGFGYSATPLVEDERVILPVGGPNASLVALHTDDGRTLWATGSDPASHCPAMPISFRGRRCVVAYLQNAFILVEAATGKLLHRQALSTGYDENSAWPLYREPHLLLLRPFRTPATCLRLEPGTDGSLTCRVEWTKREMCNDVFSSVLHDGHVYGFDLKQTQTNKHGTSRGVFKCLEWSTGKVRWSTEAVGHAGVLVADDKLLLLNDTGSLILARAEATAYRELGRAPLFQDELCWTPPTLWRGQLFVRSPARAVCVYVGRPENRPATTAAASAFSWRFDTGLLLTRPREFPNDELTTEEIVTWFGAGVLVLVGAALGTGLLLLLGSGVSKKRLPGSVFFFGLATLLGFLGPNVFSTLFDRCLFTWPVVLYAAFHATLLICAWAAGQPGQRRSGWLARLTMVGFLLVCYGYFELCQTVGMFVAWSFLFGFLAAFPLTYLAVRAARQEQRRWIVAGWTLMAFTAYFWSSQALVLWKGVQES